MGSYQRGCTVPIDLECYLVSQRGDFHVSRMVTFSVHSLWPLLLLADDHDALKFLTTSLLPEGQQPVATQTIADSEKEKFSKEYEQYKDKLERQKEEYRKQHPEEAAKHDMEHGAGAEQPYDSPQQRELRQIFEGQAHMFEGLKAMHRKLDEMLGRQERTLSLVSGIQQSGAGK